MKALVTGATGHIGCQVVRACIAAGIVPIALARPASPRRALAGLDIEVREGDLLDSPSIARAMEGVELVFHVGAVHRNYSQDETQILRPAVEGTRHVIDSAVRAGVRRVVLTSSGATVGFSSDPAAPLDETSALEDARSPYTRAKIQSERLALAAAHERRIEVVSVNPSGVFGPLDYRLTPATRAVVGLLQGDPSFLAVSVTDVRDVARGHILAAEKGTSGERYLLTGDVLDPSQMSTTFGEVGGITPKVMRPPRVLVRFLAWLGERKARSSGEDAAISLAQIDDVWGRHLAYSSKRARTELGATFRPAADVLRDTFRWLLFVGALEAKVAACVREKLGTAAAPDADWAPAA